MKSALLLLAFSATTVFAQLPAGTKPPGEDWIQLYNGKDISNWNSVGGQQWTSEDGILTGKAVNKSYGYLETPRDYKDFQLSLRFKCVGSGNSGVYFHTKFKPGTADVSQGAQFEIDCRIGQHTAGVYGFGRAWIVWPSPQNETVVRQTDWNEMLVTVEGNHYTSRLNGVPMVDFTDPRAPFIQGTIALQLHSGGDGHMQFKDIWVRDLTKK
ncbi:3-keto-disaccharide hydrolase [Paludibaculum fermentans]|uniref:3-keto-disaccharide hydrolase n=1 Tax=Paludibaculum fermentans TaxID=1473598 RepID=UPI003EB69F9A